MTTDNNTSETLDNTAPTRCACHSFEIESWTGEVPEGGDPGDFVNYEGTGCTQYTQRIFAPGHDAKLKSLLIQAGVEGNSVRRDQGGMSVISSAEQVAAYFGFEFQVLAGIKRAQAKAEERAEKKAAKAAAKATPRAPRSQKQQKKGAEVEARIKVGRHFYDAVISPDGTASYTTKAGAAKTAATGTWKLAPLDETA